MRRLRVLIATSNPHGNAARICHHLAQSAPDVTIVGAIVDTRSASDRSRQLRRLRAWHHHGGPGYVLWRLWLQIRPELLGSPSASRYDRSLHELGSELGFPVVEVPNMNSRIARDAFRELKVDLGVSVSNRVIDEHIYSVPTHGMINLHHGRIPTYRGGPPAFWEIYHGEQTMGISVHRIDSQLDHGELLGLETVPIRPGDDPATVMERAYAIDHRLVERVVSAIARGTTCPIPVDLAGSKVLTFPSRVQLRELQARLGRHVLVDDGRRARIPPLSEPARAPEIPD